MRCTTCGFNIPAGVKYCPSCLTPIKTPYDTELEKDPPSTLTNPGQPVFNRGQSGQPEQPGQPPFPTPPYQTYQKGKRRRTPLWLILASLLMLVLVIFLVFYGVSRFSGSSSSPTLTPTPSPFTPVGMVTSAPNGESIGISDGTLAFDTNRSDGTLKRQAADRLKRGDINGTELLWKQALAQDTNDAETLIYQEDQRILDSHRPYFTLVTGAILTGNLSGTGRDSLQGAYVEQKEYNNYCYKLPTCVQLRLLVANSGTGDSSSAEVAYASLVIEQIVRAAQNDRTIVGVMGWSVSLGSVYVATVLGSAHIPLVSPTASVDAPTQKSPYFFQVAPSNKDQGIAGAKYAEQVLNARRVVLFVDPVDAYSTSLANAFTAAAGNTIVAMENYTVGQPNTISSGLSDALSKNPDLIYFAGHSGDIGALLTSLPTIGPLANVQVLGGDGLYEVAGYPTDVKGKLYRLHFTAFAYPDEWHFLAPSEQQPTFFSEYQQAFDPQGQHLGDYGYGRADSGAILSYDAMQALLAASNIAFDGGRTSFTRDDLQRALTSLAVQGVSGQISFGLDGNPTNKVVVVLHFDTGNHIHFDQPYGCFLKPGCS